MYMECKSAMKTKYKFSLHRTLNTTEILTPLKF
jgi:hypothetical protein